MVEELVLSSTVRPLDSWRYLRVLSWGWSYETKDDPGMRIDGTAMLSHRRATAHTTLTRSTDGQRKTNAAAP